MRPISFRKSKVNIAASAAFISVLLGGIFAGVPEVSAKGDDDLTFTPEDVKRVPPSKQLKRATEFYKNKEYENASMLFYAVAEKQTKDAESNRQRAQFFLGKTLYQMGYYAVALEKFRKITKQGSSHSYYGATLKWLAALAKVLPESSGILGEIGRYGADELDDPVLKDVRNELHFLLGRHLYRKAKFEEAIEEFQKVEDSSPEYIKAKFFEGVTYVRKYEAKPADAAFQRILEVGAERAEYRAKVRAAAKDKVAAVKEFNKNIGRYVELAQLQRARVFYSTRQYDLAIKYFEKLPQSSPDWVKSLFEASWAYFMKANNPKALGNIHTLNAPYFENDFFPESILLKAVIYEKYCLYDRALESVAEFNAKYVPLQEHLVDILGKHEDDAEFYKDVTKILAGKAGLAPDTQRLVVSVLRDRTLRKSFDWVTELSTELKKYQGALASWKDLSIGSHVYQELSLSQSDAEAAAGALARDRIKRLQRELNEKTRDGLKIQIQVYEEKKGQIRAKAQGEKISGKNRADVIRVDDEHFEWRFKGEYWKDELGYYRFRIRSKCPKRGAK